MAIAIVAVNPGRQFAKANNAKRFGDVAAIANAIAIRIIENKGDFLGPSPPVGCTALPATGTGILLQSTTCPAGSICYDICPCIVPSYIGAMPVDPTTGDPADSGTTCTNYASGYTLSRIDGRIKISALTIDDEGPGTLTEISVTR